MRKVQINITMALYGDQATNGHAEKITVYADSNTPYETICTGFQELMVALQENGREVPGFGVKEHRITHGIPKEE